MKDILNTLSELLIKADAKMDPQSRMMDVASEVGELSKEVLKSTKYGRKEFTMTPEFEEEYGDVLYSLLSMGLENGIDIEANMKKMIKKMNSRFGIEEDYSSPSVYVSGVQEMMGVHMKVLIDKLTTVATTGRWDAMQNETIHSIYETIINSVISDKNEFVKHLHNLVLRKMMEFVMPVMSGNNIYISQAEGYLLAEIVVDLEFLGSYTDPSEMVIDAFCYKNLTIAERNPIMILDSDRLKLLITNLSKTKNSDLRSICLHSLNEFEIRNNKSSSIDYEKIFKTRLHELLEKYSSATNVVVSEVR